MAWMRWTIFTAVCLTLLHPATAQEPQTGRPEGEARRESSEPRELRGRIREFVDGVRKATPGMTEERTQRLRRVIDQLSASDPDELRRLMDERPYGRAVSRIIKAFEAARDARDSVFVDRLPATEQDALRALQSAQRRRHINEMRLDAELDVAIANAMRHGLVSEEEADEMRAGDARSKLQSAATLNRRVFLTLHGDDLADDEVRRLESLPPAEFWRDEVVRKFRAPGFFSPENRRALTRLDPQQRRLLSEVLQGRRSPVELDSILDGDLARRLRELNAEGRLRVRMELERWWAPRERRFVAPPRFLETLAPAERRRWARMNDDERWRLIEERLAGTDWAAARARLEAARRIDDFLAEVPSWQRHRVRNMTPAEAEVWIRRNMGDVPEMRRLLDDFAKAGAFGRRLINRLSLAERAAFDGLSREDLLRRLAERFPDEVRPHGR